MAACARRTCALVRANFRPFATARSCSSETGHGALADHVTLELGQCCENAEDHATGCCCGVDLSALSGQHPQTDIAIRQILHRVDQMGKRPPETVKLPDNQHIALTECFEAGGQSRTILTVIGSAILIDIVLFDAGCPQGSVLQIERLRPISFGNAPIAD